LKSKSLLALTIVFVFLSGGIYLILRRSPPSAPAPLPDKYLAFIDEVYDKIQNNYWEKITHQELSALFLQAAQKLTNNSLALDTPDKSGVLGLLRRVLQQTAADNKTTITVSLADIVLANLKPFARSRLYVQKDEKALSDTVNNINLGSDYFQTLGLSASATDQEVAQAYQKQVDKLAPKAKESTPAAQKLTQVQQAYRVLKDAASRQIYQTSGVEPTLEYQLLTPQIFYLHWLKFSPTTFDELQRVTAKVDQGNTLDTLILDLRDNVGGAIDGLPYFLGPFIGANNYAYQFYHQGERQDFKTQIGWLPSLLRYKKVVILINDQTQSTAEVMAAVLKKYNVGLLVGTTTKGWGTVEKVLPLDHQITDSEKYSLFLVHSVTLRDDGQPIEGRGVDPIININDPGWPADFLSRFNFPHLLQAVEELY
jgi:uncharacterized protein YecT (DUF1311 family)